jgi:hypothetical protein
MLLFIYGLPLVTCYLSFMAFARRGFLTEGFFWKPTLIAATLLLLLALNWLSLLDLGSMLKPPKA